MKRFLWNLCLAASMVLVMNAVLFTLVFAPAMNRVLNGTASWGQIAFFLATFVAMGVIVQDIILNPNRRD